MQRVRIPDPMASLWAIMRSDTTPESKLQLVGALCPHSVVDDEDDRRKFLCTRRRHHTGRHAASNGDYIIAVWE